MRGGLAHGGRGLPLRVAGHALSTASERRSRAVRSGCGRAGRAAEPAEAACHLAKEKGRDRLQVYDAERSRHRAALRRHALGLAPQSRRCGRTASPSTVSRSCPVGGRPSTPWRSAGAHARCRGQTHPGIPFHPACGALWSDAAAGPLGGAQGARDAGRALCARAGESRPGCSRSISRERRSATARWRSSCATSCAPAACRASALCFEITETAAVSSLPETSALINSLRRLGCAFSLDDFGRGMSSFMYLKQLPVDYLKIDGEFVRNMKDDPVSRAMVEAIHALGQAMGIATVAECVENPDVRRQLEALGDRLHSRAARSGRQHAASAAICNSRSDERSADRWRRGMRFARSRGRCR